MSKVEKGRNLAKIMLLVLALCCITRVIVYLVRAAHLVAGFVEETP